MQSFVSPTSLLTWLCSEGEKDCSVMQNINFYLLQLTLQILILMWPKNSLHHYMHTWNSIKKQH